MERHEDLFYVLADFGETILNINLRGYIALPEKGQYHLFIDFDFDFDFNNVFNTQTRQIISESNP
ncbi:hypothetical protein [Calothrix sp. UHCC 0171]|uniref:hypothetical protein n=1 Tax=Calothrix sp. UHCC 0171 TaxID=3110245 RepID=UPI002B1F0EA0|nr:hypothetical protein [Calothrix sp. UHCC 0171]MEA5574478.1 hypothetical protein [Calothrix sp. UHCC 0171]